MAVLTATCAPAPGPTRVARVLRWTFHRDDETVLCELGLCLDESAYELRIDPPWNPTGACIELFDDAMSAFQRQTTVERILIREGWSLVRFVADDVRR